MELRNGQAFWPRTNGLMHTYPPLGQHLEADILIIGAGVTGALCADELTRRGFSVVVTDKRDAVMGSTSASTALLQYEIDTNLVDLIPMIGRDKAERAYQLCQEAIDLVGDLTRSLPDDCGFKQRGSLYYASSKKDARMLRLEHEARQAAGLEVELLEAEALHERFGIVAPAALFSPAGAEVDPYRLAQHLLWRAQQGGAQIADRTEISDLKQTRQGFRARTQRGFEIRSRWVIVAAGYEAAQFLRKPLAQLRNSYALVSEPIEGDLWPEECLLWETARPYLYARTTADRRVMVGGLDDQHVSPRKREKELRRKQRRLEKKLQKLLPTLQFETAFAWAGTFGETPDGLAYIGPEKQGDKLLFALGYGGNGITYSVQAARMLADLIESKPNPDLEVFRLDR